MVSWNEIHGHVTQRFQALFLLMCSWKTFLPSDDTVLVKMHHHDTIFKKCTRAPPPEWHDAWNLGHAHIAVRCPGRSMGESLPPGEMMKPGSCLQQMQMSSEGRGSGSCSGESWSYNGIHWVAESLAPERISSMRNVPSESFRISRGSWNLPPSLGICLSERGHWQGMALEALHWFAQNAQSQIDWKVSHYW